MKKAILYSMLVVVLFASACGAPAGPPAISVALSSGATQVMDQGQTLNITSTLTNDTAAMGVTWTLTGAGALMNQTTASVTYSANGATGTPTITATSIADTSKSTTLTVTVTAVPAITTTTLPAGTEGTAYSQAIAKTGGAGVPTFSISAGALPAGLTLSSAGTISGTPTGTTGTSSFSVKVTDSSSVTPLTSTQALSILINLPAPPAITTTVLPAGVEGTAYSQTVVVTGGLGALTFSISVGSLPAGLTISSAGHIAGTPTGPNGTVSFTVMVSDHSNPVQSTTQALSILINLPVAPTITPASLPGGNVGTSYSQILTVSNGLGPFTWTVSVGSLPAGLGLASNGTTATISGIPTTVQSNVAFTIHVSDSSNPLQNGTLAYTVSIAGPLPLSITTTSNQLPNGTNGTPYPTTNLAATGGVAPYSWTTTAGALPTGLNLSSGGAITGTPTVTGPSTFTAQVTDSTTATATASLTITINVAVVPCGSGSESLLFGQYAFTMSGFDAGGAMALGGVFNADGAGHIATTVGIEDFNRISGNTTFAAPLSITSAGSSYSVGSDHRGCLTIITSAGTSVFRFALGSVVAGVATKGRLIEFDATGTTGAGVLRKQDPTAFSTAQVTGNYAFGISGPPTTNGGRFAAAGSAVLSGGNITSGSIDLNDNGQINNGAGATSAQALTGSYVIDGTTGRTKLTFTVGSNGSIAAAYVISATELIEMSLDPLTGTNAGSPYTGSILQQSGTPFALSSLNTSSVVVTQGLQSNGLTLVPRVQVGVFSIPSSGTLSFIINDTWDGTTLTVDNPNIPTYTVTANGRVTLAAGTTPPIFYLVSANKGFYLGTDSKVDFGSFEPQTTTALNPPKTFFFGTVNPGDSGVSDSVGVATFIAAGSAVSGTTDDSSGSSLGGGQTFANTYGTFDVNGRGTINTGGNGTIIYLISPTKAVLLDATASHASYQIAEQ